MVNCQLGQRPSLHGMWDSQAEKGGALLNWIQQTLVTLFIEGILFTVDLFLVTSREQTKVPISVSHHM